MAGYFLALQRFGFQVGFKKIMKIESFGITDVGCKREKNEDSHFMSDPLGLYMVADGMGGHVGGEFASKMAVKTVEKIVSQLTSDPESTLPEEGEVKPGDYKSWLKYSLQTASESIYQKALEDNSLQGMGTTAVVLLFRNNRVYMANVGDSRCYRIRGNKIDQLSTDHSLVAEQIRAGILKPKEAKEHRLKNIITRSVGFQEEVDVDVEARAAKPGDIYFLCSDGLYNLVENDEILDIVSHQNLDAAGQHLIEIAKSRGGDDNITVIMAKVSSLEKTGADDDEESTLQC